MDIESEPRKKQTNIQTHTPKQNNEKATTTKMTRGEKTAKNPMPTPIQMCKNAQRPIHTQTQRERESSTRELSSKTKPEKIASREKIS